MNKTSQSIIYVCVYFFTTNVNFKFIRNLCMFPVAYFCFRQQLFCRHVSETSETPMTLNVSARIPGVNHHPHRLPLIFFPILL